MENIYVLGIGGSTPVLIELAEDCGYNVAGLYHFNDDKTGKIEYGYEVLGSFDDLYSSHIEGKKFLLTQGDMRIRQSVVGFWKGWNCGELFFSRSRLSCGKEIAIQCYSCGKSCYSN